MFRDEFWLFPNSRGKGISCVDVKMSGLDEIEDTGFAREEDFWALCLFTFFKIFCNFTCFIYTSSPLIRKVRGSTPFEVSEFPN